MTTLDEQLLLEEKQHATYKERFYKTINDSLNKDYFVGAKRTIIIESTAKLKDAVNNYLDFMEKRRLEEPRRTKDDAAKILSKLSDDELTTACYVALSYFFSTYNLGGVTLQHASRKIGRDVMDELNYIALAEECQEELTGINVKERVRGKKGQQKKKKYLQYISWHNMFQKDNESCQDKEVQLSYDWTFKEKCSIGLKLIELIEGKLGLIYFTRKTFPTFYAKSKGEQTTKICIKPELISFINKTDESLSDLGHAKVPMIYKPKDWTALDDGGYYTLPHYFIRIKNDMDGNEVRKFYQDKDLKPVMDAVNAVQATPWEINKKVYDVLREVLYWDNVPIKDCPAKHFPEPPPMPDYNDESAYKAWKLDVYKYHMRYNSLQGQRIRIENIMAFAREYKEYDKFYFPCNVDFRGRIFPIPPISYQGNDLERGLLCFSDSVYVADNEEAKYWLRINLANHYGLDKKTFEERNEWVDNVLTEIIGVGRSPLDYLDMWCSADNPCQFLAACIDYKNVLLGDGCSCVRVSFDGSCSGLQHYSMLFRDEVGGKAVNLIPDEKVNDIYQIVADKVIDLCGQDAERGTSDYVQDNGNIKVGTLRMAREWLEFGITRSTVKRCVMTYPYGSKEYGFQNQIYDDTIKPTLVYENTDFRDTSFYRPRQGGIYLAGKIMEAVKDTVVKASEGMEWLQKIAKLYNGLGLPIEWTSPSGFPCYMDYKQQKPLEIRRVFRESLTIKGKCKVSFNLPIDDSSTYRQKNGIAPNFIHSLDAAHMHFTILESSTQDITNFGCIHDDFGTDALSAGKLFKIVRQTFADIYSNDIAGKMYEHFKVKGLPEPPKKGSLDINRVLESKYAFH